MIMKFEIKYYSSSNQITLIDYETYSCNTIEQAREWARKSDKNFTIDSVTQNS